jgi:hypothetical protein
MYISTFRVHTPCFAKMDIFMPYVKKIKIMSCEELFLARNFVFITHDTKYIGLLSNKFAST